MKKLILFLIPFALFGKNISFEEFDKQFTEEIAMKLPVVADFKKETGEKTETTEVYVKNAYKDISWRKAVYTLYFNSQEFTVQYGEKYKKKVNAPDLAKGLEYLEDSTKKTQNPISAYQGVSILTQFYMTTQGAEIPRKYMRTFSKVLKERNYCLGYMYYGRSYFAEFSKTPNYSFAYDILKEGNEKCNKEGVEVYIPYYLKHQLVKAKSLKRKE